MTIKKSVKAGVVCFPTFIEDIAERRFQRRGALEHSRSQTRVIAL